MHITLDCSVSLSKKLRTLIASGGSIVLTANDLEEGRAHGTIMIDSGADLAEVDNNINQLFGNETSIMLTINGIHSDEVPSGSTVASIFSTLPSSNTVDSVVDKIGVVNADRSTSDCVKTPTPKEFKEVDNPKFKEYIASMNELLAKAEEAKSKTVNIDLDSIPNLRDRAIAKEQKEQMEGIAHPAFVVNDKVACITVNDLGITLALNCPYDLSRISAKRIAASRDLKDMYNQGYIKFISPHELGEYAKAVEQTEASKIASLEVYDRHEDAQDAMAGEVDRHSEYNNSSSRMEISESDIEKPTEEEQMISALTNSMQSPLPSSPPTVNKKTVHGKSIHSGKPSQATTLSGTPKSPSVRKISSSHR